MTLSLMCECFWPGIMCEPAVMDSALCCAGGVALAGDFSAAMAEMVPATKSEAANESNFLMSSSKF